MGWAKRAHSVGYDFTDILCLISETEKLNSLYNGAGSQQHYSQSQPSHFT